MPTRIAVLSKLSGLIAFSFGLLACGQPNTASLSSTPIQPASASPQKPSSQPRQAEASSSKPDPSPTQPSAEAIYTEFERLTQKACKQQEKVVGNMRYTLCSMTDTQGVTRIVSASSSLKNEGDGAGYWLNEQSDIYAIRYFHSDEVVVLLPEDKKTIVELVGNRQINVITDEARWNQLELGARDQLMTISEQFDPDASQPSGTSKPQSMEQTALQHLNTPGSVKATIEKTAIVENTALIQWQQGEAGGMMLLRKENEIWKVLTSGGGAMNLKDLSEYDVPRDTAESLLTQIDPNWRKY